MITTIQLTEETKRALERIKKPKQTYEEVIISLIEQKREEEQLLIEGYKEMAEESLKMSKEWEGTLMDGLDKNEKWNKL